MPNPIQKITQISIIFEKQGILSENFDELQSPCACFLHINVYKRVFGIFLFCLDLELFAKVKKDLVSTHSFFTFFFNNSRSKQKRKYPEHPFVDILK